jgi:hypothetical protein
MFDPVLALILLDSSLLESATRSRCALDFSFSLTFSFSDGDLFFSLSSSSLVKILMGQK